MKGTTILTLTGVTGALRIGDAVSWERQPRSSWAIWNERIRTFRWNVPKTKEKTGTIVSILNNGVAEVKL